MLHEQSNNQTHLLRFSGDFEMNWFEIIKNQRAVTETVTHVGTKTGDVPEKDEGRCYQKLLAIKDNLLNMIKPENNEIFREFADDMQTTETGWVPERKEPEDPTYSTEDTGPMEEYSRKGQNYAISESGEKLYRWINENNPEKEPPRFSMNEHIGSPQKVPHIHWSLEPPNPLIKAHAFAKVGEGFGEEEYCAALEKVQEFFNSGKEFVGIGSNKFTVNGKEFKIVAQNKYDDKRKIRQQNITIRSVKDINTVTKNVIAHFQYRLEWGELEKRIRMTPRQRPRFVYWVYVRRPYWWCQEIFKSIERRAGTIGEWWK